MKRASSLLVVLTSMLFVACLEPERVDPTSLLATVHSELGMELASIDVVLFDEQELQQGGKHSFVLSSQVRVPFSFTMVPANGLDEQRVLVVLTARDADGDPLAQSKAIVSFRPGRMVGVDLFLLPACQGVTCDPGQTCGAPDSVAGQCAQTPVLDTHPVVKGKETTEIAIAPTLRSAGDGGFVPGEDGAVLPASGLDGGPDLTGRDAGSPGVDSALAVSGDAGTNTTPAGEAAVDAASGADAALAADGSAGADAGPVGSNDGGKADAGRADAGRADAALPSEAGPAEAGVTDAGVDASLPLVACQRFSTGNCGSYTNPSGTQIPLGGLGAVMERNVGAGFETVVSASDTRDFCSPFLDGLVAPAQRDVLVNLGDLQLALHTVYRPVNWDPAVRYPIVIWGNGTCMQPETYGGLLRAIAAAGFFVVAPNSRFASTNSPLTRALDFALAANDNAASRYYRRLDTTRVAVLGHSQGGGAASTLTSDARVQAAIVFHAAAASAAKPFLVVTGDGDFNAATPSSLATVVNAAPRAAYLFYHMFPTGTSAYLMLLDQPERVTDASAAWLKYQLLNDATSRSWFVGASCTLCNRASEFEYGQHGLN